jgi:outer membrane protein assembly factor BamB
MGTLGAVVVLALGVPAVLAGCSGDDGATAATTTTVDPLAAPAVDSCGNDISELTSTVWALDPATGAVVWQAEVPLDAGYLLRAEDGSVLVPLEGRSVDLQLDATTGEVVGRPAAGVHEVLLDGSGVVTGVAGTLVVDGEQRPLRVEVGGTTLEVTTAAGALALRSVDPASGAARWTSPLGDATTEQARPVVFGGLVVVAAPTLTPPACEPG